MGAIKYIDQGHAEVFVFDHFIIKQIREGVVIDEEHKDELAIYLAANFKDKNIAYISNRVASYAVNPLIYKEVEKIPNLVAIAIVTHDKKMSDNASYEKQFYNKPYGIFDNLVDAIAWVSDIVIEQDKKTTKRNTI